MQLSLASKKLQKKTFCQKFRTMESSELENGILEDVLPTIGQMIPEMPLK